VTPRRKILLVAIVPLGLLGFAVLSWRPAIAPVEPPGAGSFSAVSVRRGEVLADEAHCISCHTAPDGKPFAGGYGVNTPFGVIFGTNITPDPTTGIGAWSREAFVRAMREGVSRDGSHLFAAFPYVAFTKLSDGDVEDLYAYVMTRPPVVAQSPANTVPFPLNIRALQAGWKLLFFRSGRFHPDAGKPAEWNRGAYLAGAVADCEGCHTPRNPLGAESHRLAYEGAPIDGWIAPALTAANPSPIPWIEGELFDYLRTGRARWHGPTSATMTPIIREGLALPVVPESEVRAIAAYFSVINGAGSDDPSAHETEQKALASSGPGDETGPGNVAAVYAAACMSCHYNSGSASSARPELALSSSLTMAEPTNFLQVLVNGVGSKDGAAGLVMPSYAGLSDHEIVELAAYLRRTRTNRPPWKDLDKRVAEIRRGSASLR
jgi:mono/diheme cytochrome c family protein